MYTQSDPAMQLFLGFARSLKEREHRRSLISKPEN